MTKTNIAGIISAAKMSEQERIIKLLEDNWPEDIPSKLDDYWSGYEAAIALIKGENNA